MAPVTTKEVFTATLAILCYFVAVLTADDSANDDQIKVMQFDVKPGGVVHEQEDTWNGVTCKFTYACQGGTKEEWSFGMTRSNDQRLYSCSVERPGGNSYLYFLHFKLEISGATVLNGQVYGNRDKVLSTDEYEVDTQDNLIKSQEGGKFKNELSRIVLEAQLVRGEL